mgnify:CR=1 FL=1
MNRLQRWAFAMVLVGGTATAALAQQGDLEAKLQEKRAKPYMTAAAWITDFDAAKAEAKKTGKLIFAYFNRSYAQ